MAKTIQKATLIKKYEAVCDQYIKKFCNKQGLEFDGWLGGIVGGYAHFADFIFNFQDIVWDINTLQPKGLIIQWVHDSDRHFPKHINYLSYSNGLKYSDI